MNRIFGIIGKYFFPPVQVPLEKSAVDMLNNLKFTNEKAIIYTRISSKSQNRGPSLDSQQEVCKNYCLQHNFNIVGNYNEITSAKEISNQKTLLDIVQNNEGIHLIVNDASRFSRNFTDAAIFLDIMKRKNITLHCANNNLIYSNSIDFKKIMSEIKDAQTEIEQISHRVKRTIQFKRITNTYFPSVPKYGQQYIKSIVDNKVRIRVETNERERKIIRLIKMMYFGEKADKIEKLLNEFTGSSEHKMYDYVNNLEVSEVKFGNMRKKDIADFLNFIGIYKRSKKWSPSMISIIVKSE